MLLLVGVALVGPTESRGAFLSSTDCPDVETNALPTTLSGLRLALLFPSCRPGDKPLRAAQDRWLARDKAKHVVFSGLWTLSTQYVLVSKADWSEPDALPASIASGAAVGIAKELYDASRPTETASGKDLVADAVGIGLAVGVIML
ncbi:MAG: hypothetical protein ABEL04_09575 [Salinibacter sp.]|uniref:hypothetical protein n=1 Tax=Salinibacter sp. TaxID=2065818 RepID=UPI0035D3EB8F